MRNPARRRRFYLETWLAALTGFLAILTAVWPDWIEGVFGVDPDDHNGSFEVLIVVVLAVVTVGLAVAARFELRRAVPGSE